MSSPNSALEIVTAKKFAFWKLYKGQIKVSQCGEEENPSKDPAEAAKLFREELELRAGTPGSYYVNTFRNINGDKGGFRYDFTIDANQQTRLNSFNSSNQMQSTEELRDQIRRELKIEASLQRIEEKMDAILAYVVAKESDDKDDDSPAFEFLKTFASQAMKTKSAAPVISPGGFGSLNK